MLNCQKKIKRSLQKLFLEITKPKLALYLVQIMLAFEISDVFSYLLDVLPLVVAWNHIVRSVSLVRSDKSPDSKRRRRGFNVSMYGRS